MNIKKCTNVSGGALHLCKKAHCGKFAYAIQKKPNGEPQVTQAHCVTRDITQVNYRERMWQSLGLKICLKMEIKIDETYHVAIFCCP